jgi:hypothetical protein
MRPIRFAGVVLVAALVVVTATAAAAGSATKVTCTLQLQTLAAPGASGEDFGTVDCGHVFGKGVQHDPLVTVTPASATTGTATGSFKEFFDAGTIHGTFNLTYTVTPPTAVAYSGTAKISGGTGAYKHVKGSAKVVCSSSDAGTHTTCTDKVRLTHS